MPSKIIAPNKWVWMPHPAHFICAKDCKFHLATYVGKYIVSTVGEYWPDSKVREIFADVRGKKIKGNGDDWDRDYIKQMGQNGFTEIGANRLYETMVFKAVKAKEKSCCPYRIIVEGGELDFAGYNDPLEAYKGHLKLCKKWSTK